MIARGAGRVYARRAFTLIEVIVSMAVMSVLLSIFMSGIDRSTGSERLANEVEVFDSKLQAVRLLAGSTQTSDDPPSLNNLDSDKVGYYALVLNSGREEASYSVIKVSWPLTPDSPTAERPCPIALASQLDPTCLVEKVKLQRQLTYEASEQSIFAYRVPSGNLVKLKRVGSGWQEEKPVFSEPLLSFHYRANQAVVSVEAYTGKLKVKYVD